MSIAGMASSTGRVTSFRSPIGLAQGEFDAFLLAPENERAELLEKITGTEIYAAISVRVHEGTESRRRTVLLLEQRRDAIGLADRFLQRQALILLHVLGVDRRTGRDLKPSGSPCDAGPVNGIPLAPSRPTIAGAQP
jgi:hypothetical protein